MKRLALALACCACVSARSTDAPRAIAPVDEAPAPPAEPAAGPAPAPTPVEPSPGRDATRPSADGTLPPPPVADAAPAAPAAMAPAPANPRVVITTDIGNEPDDSESMVRLLSYANELDVEAIVATTSTWLKDRVLPEMIRERIRAYGLVRNALLAHAPGFPTAESLLACVHTALPVFGMAGVGAGKDSDGSNALIAAADRDDPRPLWVSVWGGANALAQALWKVKQTRGAAELAAFVRKLRVYTISDQDDAGPWIRKTFPDLFYIVSPSSPTSNQGYAAATWTGFSGDKLYGFRGPDPALVSNDWVAAHVRGHGPLGDLYPSIAYAMEGDTPSWLYLVPNGLGVPERPDWGGWGGRYVRRDFWTDAADSVKGTDGNSYTQPQATIWRWREAYQNDFQARMDWQVKPYAAANHPPVVAVDGPRERTVRAGERVTLDARASRDPDGQALEFAWTTYREAGSYQGVVAIDSAGTAQASLVAPLVTDARTLHVVLDVRDAGTPRLHRYARVVLTVTP
jgi:hypothetical protein